MPFANTIAAIRGDGTVFADLKADRKKYRPWFANTKMVYRQYKVTRLKRQVNELKCALEGLLSSQSREEAAADSVADSKEKQLPQIYAQLTKLATCQAQLEKSWQILTDDAFLPVIKQQLAQCADDFKHLQSDAAGNSLGGSIV